MRSFLAIVLISLGVIALVLPLIPGAWLTLIGLGLLLKKSPQEVLVMLKEKWSVFRSAVRKKRK